MSLRQLKSHVFELLQWPDWAAALQTLGQLPARKVVNPLFGLLYHGDPTVRWRAVSGMGAVVSKLADEQIESARIIMRRFMWNLNDESGGIGWGSPEAMGEIMASHAVLALEFGCILVSYADPEGNFLEHPGLQTGLMWALGRLGRVHPELVVPSIGFIKPHLQSPLADLRGMSVWALQPFADGSIRALMRPLLGDDHHLLIYIENELVPCVIGDLAGDALTGQSD